jgi:hypothetical protein
MCVTLVAILVLFSSMASAVTTCSGDTWIGGHGPSGTPNDWNVSANWSIGTPGVGTVVCINSGTPTIDDGDPLPTNPLGSLTIAGGASLTIQISEVLKSSSTTIQPGGTLTLDGTYYGNAGNATLGDGTVTNQGTINMEGAGYAATLYGTIVNQGTLNVINNTDQICYGGNGGAGSFDNQGTVNIAATSSDPSNAPALQVVGCTFTNDTGGKIVNNGGFTVEPAGGPTIAANYTQGNGTESGNAVFVHAGATLSYTGNGASSVEINDSTSMTGNLSAGQSLQLDIGTVVTVPSSFTNAGTITLNPSYYGGGGGPAELSTTGTITNNGSILAESNDGDPSFSGNVVNNGTLTITPNTEVEQLAGTFTNSGTIQPEFSSTQSSDMRFDTGSKFLAGGTVAPQLEGGFAPALNYEYQTFEMKGGSYSGTFATVSGDWHADYVNTGYLGLVYGTQAASSPGTATSPSVKGVTGGAALIKATITCAKSSSSCVKYTLTGTVTEHLKGSKVTAVSARAAKNAKAKAAKTKVVKVASASGTLASGTSRALSIKLNAAGQALLKRFGKLKVKVTITAGGKTVKTATVSVTRAKAKPKKRK